MTDSTDSPRAPLQSQVLDSHFIGAERPTGKLIVVLHGRGDSYRGFLWMPRVLGLSGVDYLLINAPDDYFSGYSWYDLPPDQGPGVVRSRALLDQLFTELEQAGRQDRDILLFGFSQGCLMALEWGTRTDRHLAGYVGISGYCYDVEAMIREASGAGRAARFLITHGTADEVVPYQPTADQIARLQASGFSVQFHSFAKAHTIDPEDELPLVRAFIAERLGL